MDLKGLSWIGNIYEKFEAMCLDMEEVMYQDTVKYVENQVQTVGASVKRFYSEVMQDLEPESRVDPVKVAAADLSLNPNTHIEMNRKSSVKKDIFGGTEKLTDDYKVISGKIKTGAYKRPITRRRGHSSLNYSLPVSGSVAPISRNVTSTPSYSQREGSYKDASRSVDVTLSPAVIEENSGEAKEKIHNQVVDTVVPLSGSSVDSSLAETKLLTLSSGRKQADSGNSSPSSCFATETFGACLRTNSGVISQTDEAIKGDAGLGKSGEEDIMMSHKERLDECSSDAAKNDHIIDEDVEIIEKFNDIMLAETCVLVEEDMRHFLHQSDGKQKSYKKKLREAFFTKKGLKRKEYEKLAARYKEQISNQESAERLMLAPEDSSAKISPAHNYPESEWELL